MVPIGGPLVGLVVGLAAFVRPELLARFNKAWNALGLLLGKMSWAYCFTL
jgi:hypothetical protein